MSVADPKLRQRLARIRALAERGVGGERLNAQRVLRALLNQHGLDERDLDQLAEREERSLVWLPYRGAFERSLIVQTAAMVLDRRKPPCFTARGKRGLLGVEATLGERVQIEYAYLLFRRAWRLSQDDLFVAFLHRSEIFSASAMRAAEDEPEGTEPLEPAQATRIVGFMAAMDRVAVRRAIGAGA